MWRRVCSLKSIHPTFPAPFFNTPSFLGVVSKVFVQDSACGAHQSFSITGHRGFHSTRFLKEGGGLDATVAKQFETSPAFVDTAMAVKVKRKKLKTKRAIVSWVKRFRYLKKRQLERMTPEEQILLRLDKAVSKEERIVETLKKLEPNEYKEKTHDPEILTPEERFYFMKMAVKRKNYVPIGRRGIYQGVILNMHLHWKKHETLQVFTKTFTPVEVKEIAAGLARLTGGIVLDVQAETILMYRGKNYVQPPTEIMNPRVLLGRKKAFDKYKYRDSLRAMRKYIPRLEQELELFRAQFQNKDGIPSKQVEAKQVKTASKVRCEVLDDPSDRYNEIMNEESESDVSMSSESEEQSDVYLTESDKEEIAERPLYLDQFDKFPAINKKKEDLPSRESADLANFDEVDQVFLRAAKLLKKQARMMFL